MATKYIKKASKTPETDDHKTQAAVQDILNDIAKRKEVAIKELNKKFDKYDGEVIVSKEKIEEAIINKQNRTKVKILPLIIKENSLVKSLRKFLIMLNRRFYAELPSFDDLQ